MNEKEMESVREEAKEILAKFSKELGKVKLTQRKRVVNDSGYRKEGSGMNADEDFRKIMFENAPEKDGDYLIAEKKEW